jgi:hypothetical protein
MTYGETFGNDKPNLIVTGQFAIQGIDNFEVCVYPDIKSSHHSQSPHELDDHATTYWFIPHVIAQGTHHQSTSQAESYLKTLTTALTEVYQLDNIYEMLDNPNWSIAYPSYSMIVPVRYYYDGRRNKAVTFYVTPNPTGRIFG